MSQTETVQRNIPRGIIEPGRRGVQISCVGDEEGQLIGMTRWEVLKENVSSPKQLRKLCMLLRVIDTQFSGEVRAEKDLTGYMSRKHRWGNKTTRHCLGVLVNLRLLRCVRDPRDRWTKTYHLVDA